ncbi:MAG: hypothetical protein H6815_10310 [Phycisphaeraceae bacterium]|nr:hypothetical protein [Phycisphaerales bacterium]MCB9860832.1 hypothetical protein [Phycisphaeraceae bacterium]
MTSASNKHTLTLAHSPDADDMVMWWPITGARDPSGMPVDDLPTEPLITSDRFTFSPIPADVQTLNELALKAATSSDHIGYDITAISAAVYPHIANTYQITRGGSSFGEGYGPKVVVLAESNISSIDALITKKNLRIVVPGLNTTAFMLLSMIVPEFTPVPMPFDRVIDTVKEGNADAGLLIHEAQLTFASLGLRSLLDLGIWWHEHEQLPLPLGLNVLRRDLDERFGSESCAEVASLLSQSISHAIEQRDMSKRYLLAHSESRPEWRDDALLEKYLSMYVSPLTADMGDIGIAALERLYSMGRSAGVVPSDVTIDPI